MVSPIESTQEAAQQLLKRANVANAKRTQIASGGLSAIREATEHEAGEFCGDSGILTSDFMVIFMVILT